MKRNVAEGERRGTSTLAWQAKRGFAIALVAAAAPLGAPAVAGAHEVEIEMPGKFFEPARVTAVAGDRVTFRNNDLVTHDVRLGGGLFDSGPIVRFSSWAQPIEQPGEYPFVCTLHAFMSGNLSVVPATLAAEPDGVLAGEPLTLSGRAPAGSARVGVERSAPHGGWVALDAEATPDPDGRFAVKTRAVEGASYRVTTAAGTSAPVTPRVTARVELHVALQRGKRRSTLQVHAMPAPAGMVATLELYARWRYRWRAERTVRLDEHGSAAFRLRRGLRTYARVSLRRSLRGPSLVSSHALRTSDGRIAPDPDTIKPPGGGHDGGAGHGGGGGGHDGGGH
jgi:plastocyanin